MSGRSCAYLVDVREGEEGHCRTSRLVGHEVKEAVHRSCEVTVGQEDAFGGSRGTRGVAYCCDRAGGRSDDVNQIGFTNILHYSRRE